MALSKLFARLDDASVLRPHSGPLTTARITGKLLATQGYVIGIEIGGSGSRLTVALANLNGKLLYQVRHSLENGSDPLTVLKQLDEILKDVASPERLYNGRILRVGVAIGGLVDAKRGIVRKLYHAQEWTDFPFQDYMADRLDAPCIIDNNANAAALAEVKYGAIASDETIGRIGELVALYVGLGRGIGGGLVVNQHIYHGASSTAGEIGHMLVKENGPQCSCGGYGHLEAIASAQAIVRRMQALSHTFLDDEAALQKATDRHAEPITAEQVFRRAAEGDESAQKVVREVQTYLGIALANIIHLINPGVIILGGQVAQAGQLLLVPLQEQVRSLCLVEASESVRIVQGKLGIEANIVGAITLALQDL